MLAKIVFNVLLLSLFFPTLMAAQSASEFQLADYQWKDRLLFIFAFSQESADYKEQLEELNSQKEGLIVRDLKIFHLFSDDSSFGDGARISEKSAVTLYQKYKVKPGRFTVILIGKDGTEKLRRNSLLITEKLFSRIDSMPMRRREMRDQGS